jgi:protein involved in polysaccharide export with SLBB domain
MSLKRVSELVRGWTIFIGLVGMAFLAAGCKSGSAEAQFRDAQGAASVPVSTNQPGIDASSGAGAPMADSADVIHVQDALTITLSDLPYVQPPIEERVKDDGTINLIENQKFNVGGKKRGVVEEEIYHRYVPKLFKTITVSVQKQKDTQFYYVGGEVKLPSREVYISRITVLKAIQSAGWFTDFASKTKVQLTRADGRVMIINCKKALKNPKLDLEVYPGDTIHVPRKIL